MTGLHIWAFVAVVAVATVFYLGPDVYRSFSRVIVDDLRDCWSFWVFWGGSDD